MFISNIQIAKKLKPPFCIVLKMKTMHLLWNVGEYIVKVIPNNAIEHREPHCPKSVLFAVPKSLHNKPEYTPNGFCRRTCLSKLYIQKHKP